MRLVDTHFLAMREKVEELQLALFSLMRLHDGAVAEGKRIR